MTKELSKKDIEGLDITSEDGFSNPAYRVILPNIEFSEKDKIRIVELAINKSLKDKGISEPYLIIPAQIQHGNTFIMVNLTNNDVPYDKDDLKKDILKNVPLAQIEREKEKEVPGEFIVYGGKKSTKDKDIKVEKRRDRGDDFDRDR